jgi:uncharacterized RDD family membrane protein YckC
MNEHVHDSNQSVETPAQPELASPPQRFMGQFLDALVAYAMIFAALALDSSPLFIVAWAFAILYILLADGLPGGQSLGKKLLRMRVIDEKSGRACTFGGSFLRNLMLAFLGPIDWIFIFGRKHQRLGDKAAGTIVVKL